MLLMIQLFRGFAKALELQNWALLGPCVPNGWLFIWAFLFTSHLPSTEPHRRLRRSINIAFSRDFENHALQEMLNSANFVMLREK